MLFIDYFVKSLASIPYYLRNIMSKRSQNFDPRALKHLSWAQVYVISMKSNIISKFVKGIQRATHLKKKNS